MGLLLKYIEFLLEKGRSKSLEMVSLNVKKAMKF